MLNIPVQHHQKFQGKTKPTEQLQTPIPPSPSHKKKHIDLTSISIYNIKAPGQAVQNFKVNSDTNDFEPGYLGQQMQKSPDQ